MRILMAVGSLSVASGGPPRVIAGSAKALALKGHQVHILCPEVSDSLEQRRVLELFPDLSHPSIKILEITRSAWLPFGCESGLSRFLKRDIRLYDAVHLHGIWEPQLWLVARQATQYKVPFFVSAHGMLDPWSMRSSKFKKAVALKFFGVGKMLSDSHGVIFGSTHEADSCHIENYSINKNIVPNGVSDDFFNQGLTKSASIAEFDALFQKYDSVITFMGRIHPKKGIHRLISAFELVAQELPNAAILVLGLPDDKQYEKEIIEQSSRSEFSARIKFYNTIKGDLARQLLARSDIFVLPSFQEGFSMAVLEAMGAGLPVVVSDQCHLPEVAREWDCGVVATNSVADFATGLRSLLRRSKSQRLQMGMNGQKIVKTKFAWDVIADDLLSLYSGRAL